MKRHQSVQSDRKSNKSSDKDRRQRSSSSRAQSSRRRDDHPKSSRHQSRGESLTSETASRSRHDVFASDEDENGVNEVHLYGKVTTVDSTGTKNTDTSARPGLPSYQGLRPVSHGSELRWRSTLPPGAPTLGLSPQTNKTLCFPIGSTANPVRQALVPKMNPQMQFPPLQGPGIPQGVTPEMMSLHMASYFGTLPRMGPMFPNAGLTSCASDHRWPSSTNVSSLLGIAAQGNSSTPLAGFGQLYPGLLNQGKSPACVHSAKVEIIR